MVITNERVPPPPNLEQMPSTCPICDSMISLGLISATCESLPSGERTKCHEMVKPLEQRKQSAVDTLANILVEIGDDQMNDSLDRMNTIIWQATEKAKNILISKGKLNKDGSQKE